MYFQIENIVIWPSKANAVPSRRIVRFEPGKVNVITGESRTGKSAVIPIIDYCLCSSRCAIPIDVIRSSASWYGVTIVNNRGEHILVARKAPEGKTGSAEMSLTIRNETFEPPECPPERNKSLQEVKDYFDSLFAVPYIEHDGTGWGDKRLGFRDLAHMAFQSQDVVANQNVLFYKMHEIEYRMRLSTWFRFIVGAETEEFIRKQHEEEELRKQLRTLETQIKTATAAMANRSSALAAQFTIAKELGLFNGNVNGMTLDQMILAAEDVVSKENDASIEQKFDSIFHADEEIVAKRTRFSEVARAIADVRCRLNELEELRKATIIMNGIVTKRKDRLEIAEWMAKNTESDGCCPFCGSTEQTASKEEFDKILSALKRHEENAKIDPAASTACDKVKQRQEAELRDLLAEQESLKQFFAEIAREREEARKGRDFIRQVYQLISEMRATVKLAAELDSSSELIRERDKMKATLTDLETWLKAHNAAARFKATMEDIGRKAQVRLGTLDVENRYKASPVEFDQQYLNVKVRGNDGEYHLLSEVGSASNWVSCHIAYLCALQEYFVERDGRQSSFMPSFVVFDQPSQVYFPQMKIPDEKYSQTDVAAVRKMFQTMSDSVTSCGGKWQAIVLEHADDAAWDGIPNVRKAEEWRNGTKLIPTAWYEEK